MRKRVLWVSGLLLGALAAVLVGQENGHEAWRDPGLLPEKRAADLVSRMTLQRVHLRPGQSSDVSFTIPAAELPKEKVRISVGGGQPMGKVSHLEAVL